MKSSTQDKIEGAMKTAAGTLKEKTGRTVRDPEMQDRGTMQKAEGKIQSKVGDIKKVFDR